MNEQNLSMISFNFWLIAFYWVSLLSLFSFLEFVQQQEKSKEEENFLLLLWERKKKNFSQVIKSSEESSLIEINQSDIQKGNETIKEFHLNKNQRVEKNFHDNLSFNRSSIYNLFWKFSYYFWNSWKSFKYSCFFSK